MRKSIFIVALVFCVFFGIINSAQSASKPTIFFEPNPKKARVCEDFWINVKIRDVEDLHYYNMTLSFPTDELTYKQSNFGNFIPSYGGGKYPEEGKIQVTQVHKDSDGGSSGTGILFQVEFHCKKEGEPTLTLSSITLKDKNDIVITEFEVENCKISQVVGGVTVSIVDNRISVDKFDLAAPYVGLASIVMVATVATAIYVKRAKPRKEKT